MPLLLRRPYMSLTGRVSAEYIVTILLMALAPRHDLHKAEESPISSIALSAQAHQCMQRSKGYRPR